VAENKLSSPAIIVIGSGGDSKKSKRFYKELRSTHNNTAVWKGMNCTQYF
jgi:hypothetical protein